MHQPDSETGRKIEKRPKKAISKFSGFFFYYMHKKLERESNSLYGQVAKGSTAWHARSLFNYFLKSPR